MSTALRSKSYVYKKYGAIAALEDFFSGIGIHVPIWTEEIEELGHDPETYWKNLALTLLSEVD